MPSVETQAGTWVLQADAAARAGCSLSAIRKWRRLGAVAARMTTNSAGQERVEVRLEDVMGRVGQQAGELRRPAQADDEGPPPGTVLVALPDLEVLFERIADAERRVDEAEAKLQAGEDEARFLLGRLAELRQQLEAERARPNPVPLPRPPPSPTAPPTARRAVRPTPASPRPAPTAAPAPAAPAAAPRTRPPVDLTSLAAELHQLYMELRTTRPSAGGSPSAARRRRRTLTAYDAALLTACQALGVSRPPRAEPLTAERRAELSKALAGAGLDVRVSPLRPTAPLSPQGVGRR